jgi:hypothetical protein
MADRFLIITKVKVIDVPASPGPPPVAEVSHLEVNQAYVEDAATQVAINLELPVPNMDAYRLSFNGPDLNASIQPVTIKGGARAPGTGREIVEIEAGGNTVGSAEVEV